MEMLKVLDRILEILGLVEDPGALKESLREEREKFDDMV